MGPGQNGHPHRHARLRGAELCIGNVYTRKVDVWSLGAMLLGLLGHLPRMEGEDSYIETTDYAERVKKVIDTMCKKHPFTDAKAYLLQLIRCMMKLKPGGRPSAVDCQQMALDVYQRFVHERQQQQRRQTAAPAPASSHMQPKRQGSNMSQTGSAPPRKKAPVSAVAVASSSHVQGQQTPRTAALKNKDGKT